MSVFEGSVRLITEVLENSRHSYEVIFVDDGSTDGTRDQIKIFCQKKHNVRYIFHTKNIGRGGAVTSGIKAAKGNVVCYMDIDCEVSPVYLPYCISLVKNGISDIIIGKRIYVFSLSSEVRTVISHVYHLVRSVLFSIDVDTESGYKIFNRKKIMPVLSFVRNQRWFWDTESTVYAKRNNLRILEIPVLFLRRTDKRSSIRLLPDIVMYIANMWELYWRLKK
jgi:glycosyltransferase involved in cell wall biosynthesis